MTREEAIKELENMRKFNYTLAPMEVFDMAINALSVIEDIKALEQEPCEDCISRQAVDRLAMRYLREPTDKHVAFYEEFIALPPVTPKPKTGHWIFNKTIFDRHGCTAECSSCHKKWKTYDEIRFKKEHNYCPNCGADMRENKETE